MKVINNCNICASYLHINSECLHIDIGSCKPEAITMHHLVLEYFSWHAYSRLRSCIQHFKSRSLRWQFSIIKNELLSLAGKTFFLLAWTSYKIVHSETTESDIIVCKMTCKKIISVHFIIFIEYVFPWYCILR